MTQHVLFKGGIIIVSPFITYWVISPRVEQHRVSYHVPRSGATLWMSSIGWQGGELGHPELSHTYQLWKCKLHGKLLNSFDALKMALYKFPGRYYQVQKFGFSSLLGKILDFILFYCALWIPCKKTLCLKKKNIKIGWKLTKWEEIKVSRYRKISFCTLWAIIALLYVIWP